MEEDIREREGRIGSDEKGLLQQEELEALLPWLSTWVEFLEGIRHQIYRAIEWHTVY